MATLAPAFIYRHTRVRITTERSTEFIDLTDGVQELLAESGIVTGFLNIQSLHTTAAIVVNEGEPLLLQDFEVLMQNVAPVDATYRHDNEAERTVNLSPGERPNGASHCRALLLGSSVCLNIVDGRLLLGRWQRVFLTELDGPRLREISVLAMGEAVQSRATADIKPESLDWPTASSSALRAPGTAMRDTPVTGFPQRGAIAIP